MDSGEEEGGRLRLSRTKVRIERDRILDSAYHLMSSYASAKTLLEIEYFDEVPRLYMCASLTYVRLELALDRLSNFIHSCQRSCKPRDLAYGGIWRQTTVQSLPRCPLNMSCRRPSSCLLP